MVIKIIHNNKIGAYAFMLLLIILAWIKPILVGSTYSSESFETAMPLWKIFSFLAVTPWLSYLFSIVSTIIIALSINRFGSKYALLSKQSALPGIVFVMLIAVLPKTQQFSPFWITSLLFIITLEYIFEAHNYRKVMKECFLAAFWLSVASLVSYQVILLFPMLIILLGILRLLTFKSFLAAVIGFVLPWVFLFGYELLWGTMDDLFNHLQFSWNKIYESHELSTLLISYLALIALIFVIALFSVLGSFGTKKIYTRKQYQVFTISGLFFASVMLVSGLNIGFMPLLAVPFSIIIAHLIDHVRSVLWQNVLAISLFVLLIIGQILL